MRKKTGLKIKPAMVYYIQFQYTKHDSRQFLRFLLPTLRRKSYLTSMPEFRDTPKGFDFVADILKPTKLIVWGELAVAFLGSHAVHSVSSNLTLKHYDTSICHILILGSFLG